jgi:general secretion pathway protein D
MKKLALALLITGISNVYASNDLPPLPRPAESPSRSVASAAPPTLPPMPVSVAAAPVLKASKPYRPGNTYKADLADGVKLTEFARNILKDVAKKPFVFTPEFLSFEGSVGIDSKTYKNADSINLLRDVLKEMGFQLLDKGDYFTIIKSAPGVAGEPIEDFVYKLRARDLPYLSSILQPLFKDGAFNFDRRGPAVDSSKDAPSTNKSTGKSKPVDDGKSEFSNVTNTGNDTFVFRGTKAEVARLKDVLSQIDVPAAQVMVRAFFVEVSNVQSAGGGVSFVSKLLSAKLGISVSGSAALTGNTVKFQTPDFSGVIAALDSDSAVRTTVSPVVITRSGVTADFSVANQIPSLGQIQQNGNGQSSQSVDRIKAGSILQVTPTVYEDLITVAVHQEISQPVDRDSVIPGAKEIAERTLTSSFDVKNDTWIAIGGYSGEITNNSDSRVPFTKIPLSKTKNSERRDMVLLLYVGKI